MKFIGKFGFIALSLTLGACSATFCWKSVTFLTVFS